MMLLRAGLATACLASAITTGLPPLPQPIFRSEVSVVRLDVLATDGRRPLAGLTAADFEVRDNGVLQRVSAVFGEQEPLDVLFTFDHSSSTRGETLRQLRASARAVVEALDSNDRAGLLAFNQSFRLVVPIGPPAEVADAIDEMQPVGGTALLDAASVALNLTAASQRRTMILLFTDGADTVSWLPYETVLDEARGSDAVFYAVAIGSPASRAAAGSSEAELQRVAEATGGRLLRAEHAGQLQERFLDILLEMRSRYVLTYVPSTPAAPGWHTVTVRLRERSGRVSTRAGYVVPEPAR